MLTPRATRPDLGYIPCSAQSTCNTQPQMTKALACAHLGRKGIRGLWAIAGD